MKAWEASTDDGPRAPVGDRRAADGDEDHALVVVWSSSEPDRIGECARLRLEGPPVLLGRGPVRPDDGCARVRFFRERPFALSECPPLAGARISRQQLRLTPREDTVDFERLGACAVLHNGIARDRGTLRSGDTLSLRDELVVVLTRRAPLAVLPSAFPDDRSGPFGCADSFGIVGESASTWRIRQEIAFAAAVDAHVMVTGSSGVGKELVARAIQALSARASEVFIARSAVSFPPTLVDAELFGNMRNYPNPGMTERQGLVGAADRGTLFLDEIGELPADLQARLLRVLDQAGEYHRLGESMMRRSSFRLIASTNRPLASLKPDLVARFALQVRVSDLNERREDVPLIVRHLMQNAREKAPEMVSRFFPAQGGMLRIEPFFVESLVRHEYTLHVRELSEIIWRSVRNSHADVLESVPLESPTRSAGAPAGEDLVHSVDEGAVRRALERHRGSASRAYRELGLPSRYALYRLMKKYAIRSRDGEPS